MTTTTKTDQALRLNVLEVNNFMGLTAFRADPNGNHLTISGKNGAGKTSAIDAIWWALGGKGTREVPEPIHRGAEKASATLKLGPLGGPHQFLVERVQTASGSRLTVRGSDGSKYKDPKDLLESFLGEFSLDPVAFLDMRSQDQVDRVLEIKKVAPPVSQVEAITEEHHEPRPGESADGYLMRLSADETGLFYLRRREANLHCDQKRKALDEQRHVLEQLGGPLTADEQPQSVGELSKKMQALMDKDMERRAAFMEAEAAKTDYQQGMEKQQNRQDELEGVKQEIIKLRATLAKAEDREKVLTEIVKNNAATLEAMKHDADAAAKYASHLANPGKEIAALQATIDGIEDQNKRHARRQSAQQETDRLATEVEQAQAHHGKLHLTLTRLRDLRKHLLDGMELGVPGLQVGEGELRINDIPFRQCSKSEQLRVACLVAMAQKPRLRLLRVDDGERLDSDSREMLRSLADEQDFEVLLTKVEDSANLRVDIVEANAKAG